MRWTTYLVCGAALALAACSGQSGNDGAQNVTDMTEVVDETPVNNDSLANMMLMSNGSATAVDRPNAM
jgi:hypothetical protein